MGKLPNIIFSTSSACSSGTAKPSHVISAITTKEDRLKGSFRFGINKYNTVEEIDYVANKVIEIIKFFKKRKKKMC